MGTPHSAPPMHALEEHRAALATRTLAELFASDADVLLLDEPDNFLDIAGKRWLEDRMNASRKTILYVSHDRALLAETAPAATSAEEEIAAASGSAVEADLADLSLLSETAALAARFVKRHDRLDVLVLNAGALIRDYTITAEGNEVTWPRTSCLNSN